MTAVGNNREKWWPTQWKTKVHVIVSNFFPGFIGDSIVSTPCTLVLGDAHIIEHKSILETPLSSSKMKLRNSFTCSNTGAMLHVHVSTLHYCVRLLSELGPSNMRCTICDNNVGVL